MGFFERQDAARRHTSLLVAVFGFALVAMTAMIYVVAVVVTALSGTTGGDLASIAGDPILLLGVPLGVTAVVFGGSAYKTAQLVSAGGRGVAISLGGRSISRESAELPDRKLLNVVDEMSLAAGIPAPAVYVLDRDDTINAFAAGWDKTNACIGVTRGAITTLTRDQLQGVIAHEFGATAS